MLKNLARALLCAILATWLTPHAGAAERKPLKVGFVYVSPIGDAGWTYQHDLGRRAMEKALGDQVSTTVVESVAEGPDAERVMRDLARQGNGLIFATSFGYLEPALRVAAEFPNVRFEQTGGYKTAPNLNTYNARYYEGRYLAGLLAGKLSKSGVAGYVAGFPVPEVIQGINAFALGMRAANPKATVKVVWLDTWFDPARERDAALTLVNQGADVLTNHSASTAVVQAAEEKGVGVIAYQSDMRRIAPRAQLTAITHEWGGYYTKVARAVIDGSWKPVPVWGGMRDGFVRLAPLNASVPRDVAALVAAREADIKAGRLHPFAGRIVDREGRVRLQAGVMPDAQIATMNYFVEGVVGSLAP
ncbi:MAG: BMP family ABC transporter substrate-binding protein [Burkholderiaceae bacterium]|nr:BMP family ABC transporter substrate-binding protein [Burkholderiaceae bacterium]